MNNRRIAFRSRESIDLRFLRPDFGGKNMGDGIFVGEFCSKSILTLSVNASGDIGPVNGGPFWRITFRGGDEANNDASMLESE